MVKFLTSGVIKIQQRLGVVSKSGILPTSLYIHTKHKYLTPMGPLRQNCNHKSIFIYKKYKKRLKVFQSFFYIVCKSRLVSFILLYMVKILHSGLKSHWSNFFCFVMSGVNAEYIEPKANYIQPVN